MFKPVFSSALSLAATAVLAASVLAAGGTGPQHFNLTGQQCYDKGPYTVCTTSSGEETTVQTPSGNFSGDINVSSSFVVTSQGSLFASGTDVLHEHALYTGNFAVLQEMGIHDFSTQTSGGQTCTITQDLHVTQLDPNTGTGHIQYNNFTFVCV
jgi:type II secretory pathway pseudopilin PulG